MIRVNHVRRDYSDRGNIGTYCGLCGKQDSLTNTMCCNRPICDDAHEYRLHSFAKNSCYRNHHRYTLCSIHSTEHPEVGDDWRECEKCRDQYNDTESYVGAGTSRFNFQEDRWDGAPTFEPTYCSQCQRMIKLNCDGHMWNSGGIVQCEACFSSQRFGRN